MTDVVQPSPVQAAKNPFQRIAGVLFAPAETFRDIVARPDILVPLIVILLVSYINTAILVPKMDFGAAVRDQMAAQGREMSREDMDRAVKFGSTLGRAFAWTSPFLGIIFMVIIAGVLLLAFRLFGGSGNFKQALSVTLYSSMPWLIAAIVMAIVLFTRESVNPAEMQTLVKSNPAFLVDMKEQPVLFGFLAAFDAFTIWVLILMVIGFAIMAKVSRAKSAVIIISLWLVTILIKVGFAAMGAAAAARAKA